ncbi:MFS transporter [Paracoccus sp. TK19116]|uniref:MFS transporter n=1 Tax=Paracoccus albicereus TaxID=2922394 RepID=A0ABT1MU39_9RHOB|nr:MFS transporter [Paracoccus albicereus]MCQ0971825.1 MFS transporter [Paracoccus albicereus]
MQLTIDEALTRGGAGAFQKRLLGIFGLVWAADAMQVIAVGFAAASLASTFGLSIPEALQTGTIFFLGMFAGAWLFGRLADRIGRRNVLMLTVACDAIFGIASAFAGNFELLLILRFLTGAAVGGTLPVDYAMMAEFLPPKNRGRWLVFLEGFWAVGTIVIALTAWIASSMGIKEAWRVIYFVAAVPAVIGIFLRLWVPESPMYLLRRRREPDAREVMNAVLAENGAERLPDDARLILPAPDKGVEKGGIFAPILRSRTIAILLVWLLVSVSYYGIFIWMPLRLASEGFGFVRGYGFLVLVALAQIPGYALAAWGVERYGRKPTLQAFLILSAAGCFLFTLTYSPILIATSMLLMSFALLGTWGALYAFTPELYPTRLRGTGMGTASAMARLGGLAAPTIVARVVEQGFGLAIGMFAACLVAGAVALMLVKTETKGRVLG